MRSWIGGMALAATLASGSSAHAQNPYDAEQRRLAAEVERQGREPAALVRMLELFGNADFATPQLNVELLERLAGSRRLAPQHRVAATEMLATLRLRAGDVARAQQMHRDLGFVQRWRVIGPFDNEGKQGFDRELPPELDPNGARDLATEHPGRERPVRWRAFPDVVRFGYVNLGTALRPTVNVCGYAETFVEVPRARPVTLWVGAGGAFKLWWNGTEALRDTAYRGADMDRSVAIVHARAGWNRVLVKVCTADGPWGFYLRAGEADGSAIPGLRADPEGATVAAAAPARAPRLPAAPEAPLAALERLAAVPTPDPENLALLADLLRRTGGDDPADRRARQLAERAATAGPTIERLILAADLAEERGERMRFATLAEGIDASHPKVLLLRADLVMEGNTPEDAGRILERVPAATVEGLGAAMRRARLYDGAGLRRAALAIVEAAAGRAPGTVWFTRAHADALAGMGRIDRALELRRQVVALRHDDFGTRRQLVGDALEREDAAGALAHVEAMRAVQPDDAATIAWGASIQEALGRNDEALAALNEALALAPDDPTAHVDLGLMLLRQGRRDPAADAFRRALALRPQDAAVRELLEQIRPEAPRPDEAFATPTEQVLQRRRRETGWPATVLHDLTVNSVYENGLGSTYRQIVVQVHDLEGARAWSSYSIQFEPEAQWVDVRLARVHRADGSVLESNRTFERSLGENWYRMYFDTRALVVVFPDLEPGDTVELRYRVDDVSHRNAFADYYGDVHFLQGGLPIARLEYVLVAPAAREMFFNEPRMQGLRHAREQRGDRRVDRFFVENVPAIRSEDAMPGMTEIAPYLHVSTYRAWQDVGRWWWGLIQDQLRPDETLRRTVQDLVRGAPDTRTKVQRIFAWVVRNTRYVGLEFGIHGFKPYRVTQVVQRGFGDCKDKASLLYVMLREAGIDARIALVRTRRNGAIPDLPASLAVFDHAIAYVPELDLFLDGTAETSGTTELPAMDQGVTVLVVGPQGAELRRTPVLAPDRNRRERRLRVRMQADGAAVVEGEEEIRGGDASGFRSAYEAVGTRGERLQRSLSGLFPGAQLEEQSFEPLDDLERPVRYRWRARVPQMAQRDGDSMRLAPSVMGELGRFLARTPARRYPLDLGQTSSYVEQRVVELPPGVRVRELPAGGEARSPFGRLAVRYENAGHAITVHTELEVARDRVETEEYPAFRRWTEQADEILRQRLVLEGGSR